MTEKGQNMSMRQYTYEAPTKMVKYKTPNTETKNTLDMP